ncbi:MAG TPA: hypothetical protein PLC07_05800 [Bacillota bacterium]|nr:hypothetical protein [Bacillota bacterium]HPT86396.1 hypothetical protein [Bacillota bacterium]
MKERNYALLIGIVVTVALFCFFQWRVSQDSQLTAEFQTYAKVKNGMAMEEVEALLGPPQSVRKSSISAGGEMRIYDIYNPKIKGKWDFNAYLYVDYDSTGRVIRTRIND